MQRMVALNKCIVPISFMKLNCVIVYSLYSCLSAFSAYFTVNKPFNSIKRLLPFINVSGFFMAASDDSNMFI